MRYISFVAPFNVRDEGCCVFFYVRYEGCGDDELEENGVMLFKSAACNTLLIILRTMSNKAPAKNMLAIRFCCVIGLPVSIFVKTSKLFLYR